VGEAAPPIGAKQVYFSQASYTAPGLRSLAKFYADTANRLERSCSTATGLSTTLSRARIRAKAPARVVAVANLILKYGHVLLNVDSPCTAAKKLSAAANGVQIEADQTFPSCWPSGRFDLSCALSRRVVFRIDLEVRNFAPDLCYWTFHAGLFASAYGNSIKYLKGRGGC
jgi:hypothetical protein